MYLYIIMMFIIGWIIHPIAKKKYSKKIADIGFLLLLFPVCLFAMGLRYKSVGPDTWVYERFLYQYARLSWNKVIYEDPYEVEIGFRLMMKACSFIYNNYYFFQFIFSAIYIGLFFNLIYKYTSNVILACAIFLGGGLYMQPFNIARQMFAVAITAYSMIYLLKKQYILSILLLGIAYLFHNSSALGVCMYIIYLIRNNRFLISLASFLMIVFVMSIDQFILPLLLNLFGDKYLEYALNDFSRPEKGIILKFMWIMNLTLALISLFYYKKGNLRFLAILALCGVACYVIGLSINFADRMGLMFLPAILLMYDKIGSYYKNRILKFLFVNGITSFYILYFTYYVITIKSITYESIIH